MHVWLRHHPEIWGRWRGVFVKKEFIIKASKKQTIYKQKKNNNNDSKKKRKQKKSKTNKQPSITKNKQTRKFSEEESTIKR